MTTMFERSGGPHWPARAGVLTAKPTDSPLRGYQLAITVPANESRAKLESICLHVCPGRSHSPAPPYQRPPMLAKTH